MLDKLSRKGGQFSIIHSLLRLSLSKIECYIMIYIFCLTLTTLILGVFLLIPFNVLSNSWLIVSCFHWRALKHKSSFNKKRIFWKFSIVKLSSCICWVNISNSSLVITTSFIENSNWTGKRTRGKTFSKLFGKLSFSILLFEALEKY